MKDMFYDMNNCVSGHFLFEYFLVLKEKLVSQQKKNIKSLTYQLLQTVKAFLYGREEFLIHHNSPLMTEFRLHAFETLMPESLFDILWNILVFVLVRKGKNLF